EATPRTRPASASAAHEPVEITRPWVISHTDPKARPPRADSSTNTKPQHETELMHPTRTSLARTLLPAEARDHTIARNLDNPSSRVHTLAHQDERKKR
ncbi:MAG: hypothetical protein LC776_00690, partial [Acidobacteria bacterium]|nr:hypothetical protein [Acidobacteriota bacterium]